MTRRQCLERPDGVSRADCLLTRPRARACATPSRLGARQQPGRAAQSAWLSRLAGVVSADDASGAECLRVAALAPARTRAEPDPGSDAEK